MSEKKRGRKKVLVIILLFLLAFVTALGLSFLMIYQSGKTQFHKNDRNITVSGVDGIEVNEDTVTYEGSNYTLNKNVVSVLFMGIDKDEINNNLGYGKNGQADSLFVVAIDTSTKKITLIPIQRESMVDVNTYDSSGKYLGTNREQICLSYAYGDDAKKSCDNVKTSVIRYLMGMNISSYIAMDLKGVSDTTTKIGGVRLNAIESVKYQNRMCKVGEELLLKGKDARAYIQSRTYELDGSTKRLARQKQFLTVFASTAGNQILNDFTKLKTYYDGIMPYVNSDLTFAQVSYLVTSCLSKNLGDMLEFKSIEGEMVQNGNYAEFTPNQDSLISTIIDTFYIKN